MVPPDIGAPDRRPEGPQIGARLIVASPTERNDARKGRNFRPKTGAQGRPERRGAASADDWIWGWHAVEAALDAGVKVTGCTVHVATAEVDDGPILAQEAVRVLPDDTVETLHERIKDVERTLYIQTIKEILDRGSVQ